MPEGGRVARLEALKLLLADRDYTTAADLAEDLGVSVRTLHRDLALLRELGVPVGGFAGRGGGVYLERGWSLGRVHLNESEAMGLLFSLAIAHRVGSPLLLGDIRSIERKVTQAFAPSQAGRIRSLRGRVLLGMPASATVTSTYRQPTAAITGPLLTSFISQRAVVIHYADQKGVTSTRTIELHYLLYNLPVWYALAWDHLRAAARSFRIDRMGHCALTQDTFRLHKLDRFADIAELGAHTM